MDTGKLIATKSSTGFSQSIVKPVLSRNDPFALLPPEILVMILSLLEIDSLIQLLQSSHYLRTMVGNHILENYRSLRYIPFEHKYILDIARSNGEKSMNIDDLSKLNTFLRYLHNNNYYYSLTRLAVAKYTNKPLEIPNTFLMLYYSFNIATSGKYIIKDISYRQREYNVLQIPQECFIPFLTNEQCNLLIELFLLELKLNIPNLTQINKLKFLCHSLLLMPNKVLLSNTVSKKLASYLNDIAHRHNTCLLSKKTARTLMENRDTTEQEAVLEQYARCYSATPYFATYVNTGLLIKLQSSIEELLFTEQSSTIITGCKALAAYLERLSSNDAIPLIQHVIELLVRKYSELMVIDEDAMKAIIAGAPLEQIGMLLVFFIENCTKEPSHSLIECLPVFLCHIIPSVIAAYNVYDLELFTKCFYCSFTLENFETIVDTTQYARMYRELSRVATYNEISNFVKTLSVNRKETLLFIHKNKAHQLRENLENKPIEESRSAILNGLKKHFSVFPHELAELVYSDPVERYSIRDNNLNLRRPVAYNVYFLACAQFDRRDLERQSDEMFEKIVLNLFNFYRAGHAVDISYSGSNIFLNRQQETESYFFKRLTSIFKNNLQEFFTKLITKGDDGSINISSHTYSILLYFYINCLRYGEPVHLQPYEDISKEIIEYIIRFEKSSRQAPSMDKIIPMVIFYHNQHFNSKLDWLLWRDLHDEWSFSALLDEHQPLELYQKMCIALIQQCIPKGLSNKEFSIQFFKLFTCVSLENSSKNRHKNHIVEAISNITPSNEDLIHYLDILLKTVKVPLFYRYPQNQAIASECLHQLYIGKRSLISCLLQYFQECTYKIYEATNTRTSQLERDNEITLKPRQLLMLENINRILSLIFDIDYSLAIELAEKFTQIIVMSFTSARNCSVDILVRNMKRIISMRLLTKEDIIDIIVSPLTTTKESPYTYQLMDLLLYCLEDGIIDFNDCMSAQHNHTSKKYSSRFFRSCKDIYSDHSEHVFGIMRVISDMQSMSSRVNNHDYAENFCNPHSTIKTKYTSLSLFFQAQDNSGDRALSSFTSVDDSEQSSTSSEQDTPSQTTVTLSGTLDQAVTPQSVNDFSFRL